MKFNYTHSFADFWMLNRRLVKKPIVRATLFYISFLVLACLVLLLIPMNNAGKRVIIVTMASMGPIAVILLAAALFLRMYYITRKTWNKVAELRCEHTYEFTETGIHVTGPEIEGNIGWRYMTSAELRRGWIFIATNQNAYCFFPLSAVPEPDALLSLLIAKIPKTKGMKTAMP